jgi:uncharacterized small protein (DUF1192 family)
MGWFKKKSDPVAERARALNERIAALQAQIEQLSSQLQAPGADAPPAPPARRPAGEPVFERLPGPALQQRPGGAGGPPPGAELGLGPAAPAGWRGWWARLRGSLGGGPANPRLINYLAAGGIQGLRPLRYERRIARNRLLFICGVVALILLLLMMVFLRTR